MQAVVGVSSRKLSQVSTMISPAGTRAEDLCDPPGVASRLKRDLVVQAEAVGEHLRFVAVGFDLADRLGDARLVNRDLAEVTVHADTDGRAWPSNLQVFCSGIRDAQTAERPAVLLGVCRARAMFVSRPGVASPARP